MLHDFIYLASQSPRRAQLLQQLGVQHRLLLPSAHEDAEALEAVRGAEAPARYVQRVTGLKLQAALARLQATALPPAPILCADTTVALGRQILGKPADEAEARRMLLTLSGRSHRVLTALALAVPEPASGQCATVKQSPMQQSGMKQAPSSEIRWRTLSALSVSSVRFAALPESLLDGYVATGEPMGKAGAYAVQGRAGAFIEHISGSYSGIMGLPLHEAWHLLQQAKVAT